MRKVGIMARVGAIILAAGLAVTDVSPALAQQASNPDADLAVETAEELRGSQLGVSKVIGLEGAPSANTMSSDDGTVNKDYVYVNSSTDNTLVVAGKSKDVLDAATGLYKYGNGYYTSASDTSGACKLSGKVVYVIAAQPGSGYTAVSKLRPERQANGLYLVNGKYYASYSTRSKSTYNEATHSYTYDYYSYYFTAAYEVDLIGVESADAAGAAIYAKYGKKLSAAEKVNYDDDYDYYVANGKYYKSINYRGTDSGKAVYAYKDSEISFDKKKHYIRWSSINNSTEVDVNGKLLRVGYQVKQNDKLVPLSYTAISGKDLVSFSKSTGYTSSDSYTVGGKAVYAVRAVYYTSTEDKIAVYKKDAQGNPVIDSATGKPVIDYYEYNTSYQIVKTGAWSDAYSYAWTNAAKKTIPAVTGLAVKQKSGKKYELTWNQVADASYYYIEYYKSAGAVNAASIKEEDWSDLDGRDASYTYKQFSRSDLLDENSEADKAVTHVYFRIRAYAGYGDSSEYVSRYGAYSNIAVVSMPQPVTILPAISGLKVENNVNGTFTLKWNPIDKDAKVRVYYSKFKDAFDSPEYTYHLADAWGVYENKTVYLDDAYALEEKIAISDKKVRYTDFTGVSEVSSSSFSLVTGTPYYFAIVTYDTSKRDQDRTATTPYKANISNVSNVVTNVSFGHYTDISAPAKISATRTMGKISQPSTKSDKTSITMSFNKNSGYTGYQIYRKNKKGKYEKIVTTTSARYVDSGLAKSTVYNYKARAYYYDTVTKKTLYSDYVFFQAETSTNNYITLKAEEASKTSVKLTWTKVSGAAKYEIYRTSTDSTDTDAVKVNGYGSGAYILGNQKWELVKTISNAKTTKYTDKKLTAGTTYTYKVVATYKEGKKTKQIFASDSISLTLSVPQNLKTTLNKSAVKVTWDKDKFAAKYEVSYIIYNAQGKPYTEDWVNKTTKKNTLSISKVGSGEYVKVRVRAYGSKKWTAYTGTVTEYGQSLAAVKSISAKNVKVKDAKGVETSAVKISWKKVSGAAYYMVYRSTSPSSGFNKVEKYYFGPDDSMYLIAKESNDNESWNTVYYDDYKGKSGTIVGTSAVDRGNLQSGVTYYYYVKAYTANGTNVSEGYTKPASVVFDATPSIKKITGKKGKTVITINKVKGASKYIIYRSANKNKGYKEIGTTKKLTYTDKTTKKGTYYYKVVAVGTNGLKADFKSPMSAAKKVSVK